MQITKFEGLKDSVDSYGILNRTYTELNEFYKDGSSINNDFSDILEINEELFTILPNGSVKKTVIYISERKRAILDRYGNYPSFHIFNCETIKDMKNGGQIYKYKKASRNDGKFLILIPDDNTREVEKEYKYLKLCGYCAKKFKQKYGKKFTNLKDYNSLPINLNCEYIDYIYFDDDLESVPSFYSRNWKNISLNLKEKYNFKCQKCNIDLSNRKEFLHTHHKNGNPKNNEISNLIVLCIECHSKEKNHSHIKENEKFKRYIEYKKELNEDK